MESLASYVSASGRIARKPFIVGIALVYAASFASQVLLAAPVMARGGVIPFMLAQAAAMWAWYALHVRRLRDADRGGGMALAITVLYGLGTLLLLLIVVLLDGAAPAASSASGDPAAPGLAEFVLLIYLIALFSGDPNLGIFGYVMFTVIALILAPTLIAVTFSVWAATRRPAPASPSLPAAPPPA
jgi:uncharacterized membrane protein YhaH (DUF805 family)